MNFFKTFRSELVFTFLLTMCSAFTALSPAFGHWRCPSYRYNLCNNPVHPDMTFSDTDGHCNIHRSFKRHLLSKTNNLIDYIDNETVQFEAQYIPCHNFVQQLQGENLADILGIETVQLFDGENSVTNTYMKLAKFLRLFHNLWCLYSSRAEECCLPFSQTFLKIKNTIFSKWWIIQNSCGQPIDKEQCDIISPNYLNQDLRCENIRNIIYILLRDARNLLQDSRQVVMEI